MEGLPLTGDAAPRGLADVAWPLTTERLSLRRARAEDADVVLSYRRQPEITAWVGEPPEDFAERFVAPERLDLLLLVERAGEVVGDLLVKVEDAWAPARLADRARGVQAELGWSLRSQDTGHGFATEAVEAVLRVCFEDLGLRRVTASCFAGNVRSWRLMERVGMRREATRVADALHPSGQWLDGYTYALLAEEWRHRGR